MATIVSVNIGGRESIPSHPEMGTTGIYKSPASGAVALGPLGLAGDHIEDMRHHGGPDQAVYVYFAEDYSWWAAALGREVAPGTFGENLTVAGLVSADLAIGDRLESDGVVLEVSAPRVPCNTLARRMQDAGFAKAFRDAERPGVYCRVARPGEVQAGRAVEHRPHDGPRLGVVQVYRELFAKRALSASDLERTLATPIAERVRVEYEALLAERRRRAPIAAAGR